MKFSKEELYSAIDAYLDSHKLRIKKKVNLDDTFKELLPEIDSESMSEFAFHKALKKFIYYGNQVDKDGHPLPEVIAKREEQEKELQEKINKGEIGLYLKPKMAEFMGKPRSLRGEITKSLWKYIKENVYNIILILIFRIYKILRIKERFYLMKNYKEYLELKRLI